MTLTLSGSERRKDHIIWGGSFVNMTVKPLWTTLVLEVVIKYLLKECYPQLFAFYVGSVLFIDVCETIFWSRTSKKKLLKQQKHLQL